MEETKENVMEWQQVATEKRAIRDAKVQKHCRKAGLSDSDITAIVDEDDVHTLVHKMYSRQVTAQEVVAAYITRACDAQVKTNCLTETFFDDALQRAKELDQHLDATGALVGPLHGVPISVKDQFNVQGSDTTLGYVGRAFAPDKCNAAIVDTMIKLGAIVVAKTNLPQSIMWCETENPLWGLTTNPRNADFTPGGSSGGEGALLALHGSLVGWGTDIGGSVRIPAHMNGLWGLKPTSSRMSYQGVSVSTEGQQHVPSAIGPMARCLASLTLTTKAVINADPSLTDPQCLPVPWREDVYHEYSSRKLVIGVITDDGVVRVHPPVARVLREVVALLRDAGHEIVEWNSALHAECIAVLDAFYTADGGEDIRRDVEAGGEPFIPHVEALINRGQPISVYEYWQLNKRKVAVQKAYHDQWNDAKSPSGRPVDILLMPTMPHTALSHRGCRWVGYTKVWNVLDYTALSFPAGKVNKDLDSGLDQSYVPRNAHDAWNWERYDADSMDGHPVGLQVVGRRFDEEKVLAVASILEKLLME